MTADRPLDEPELDLVEEALPAEALLPTYTVLARLRSTAAEREQAVEEVTRRLSGQRGLFDEVVVERQEPDGSWMVLARFVVVSVEASTAVRGVYDELVSSGVPVDEVWAEPAA